MAAQVRREDAEASAGQAAAEAPDHSRRVAQAVQEHHPTPLVQAPPAQVVEAHARLR